MTSSRASPAGSQGHRRPLGGRPQIVWVHSVLRRGLRETSDFHHTGLAPRRSPAGAEAAAFHTVTVIVTLRPFCQAGFSHSRCSSLFPARNWRGDLHRNIFHLQFFVFLERKLLLLSELDSLVCRPEARLPCECCGQDPRPAGPGLVWRASVSAAGCVDTHRWSPQTPHPWFTVSVYSAGSPRC